MRRHQHASYVSLGMALVDRCRACLPAAPCPPTVSVVLLPSNKDRSLLQGHFSAVTDLAVAPGNWSLLSAARDSVVIMWDLRTFAKLSTFPVYEVIEGMPQLTKTIITAVLCKRYSSAATGA